ncbi:MAG: ATP-binding protein [Leptospira sp.]|nr:ATP-binding protein [Leptospira sp.]
MKPESNVEIMITPLDLVTYWKRVGILVDFVAGFYTYSFLPADKPVQDISGTPVFTSISTVFNEMVENAAKYSMDKKSRIKINLNQYQNIFKMQIENSTSIESAMNFYDVMKEIFQGEDLELMYIQKLEDNCENNPHGHSGIGIMMILKDYPVKMGVRVRTDEENSAAYVLIEVYYDTSSGD